MLPGIDGFEVFRRLNEKENFDVPAIFLTARTTEVDKVSGLNLGADDYITKPFGVLELIARVNAVIRRAGKSAGKAAEETITQGGLAMDTAGHILYVDGEKTELTFKEFEMLRDVYKRQAGKRERLKLPRAPAKQSGRPEKRARRVYDF